MGKVLAARMGAVVLVAGLATGCAPAPVGPDANELANFAPWNVTSKTAPRRLVSTFEAACLGPANDAQMRAMDFVPLPANGKAQVWVVDDTRPAVMIDGRSCAVMAASRTGQTEALTAMVVRRFPDARPMDAAQQARIGAERAWVAGSDVLFLRRQVGKYSRLVFGIVRAA